MDGGVNGDVAEFRPDNEIDRRLVYRVDTQTIRLCGLCSSCSVCKGFMFLKLRNYWRRCVIASRRRAAGESRGAVTGEGFGALRKDTRVFKGLVLLTMQIALIR